MALDRYCRRLIGVTAATLRRLVARGEVPAFQIGRVRRYRRSDLDAFLESARVEPERSI